MVFSIETYVFGISDPFSDSNLKSCFNVVELKFKKIDNCLEIDPFIWIMLFFIITGVENTKYTSGSTKEQLNLILPMFELFWVLMKSIFWFSDLIFIERIILSLIWLIWVGCSVFIVAFVKFEIFIIKFEFL